MTSPQDDQVEVPADARRRTAAIVGALGVLLVAGAVVAGVAVARTPSSAPPAGPPASTTPETPKVAPAASPSATATGTTDPLTGKVLPVPMSTEQYARTRTALTALAARLPAHLTLTAPASWAQYAGATPTYDEDIVSCPHIADRLFADLGARWTYTFGKLPTGPFGCTWTSVPWVPDVSRFFVSIGYQSGTVADLLKGMDYCSGGVESPHVDVPAVRQGAVLYGCDDVNGPAYDLAVPDTGGSGVFFVHATGGPQQTPAHVADALLAVLDGATRAYG
jgi:hypothetical protein